MNEEDPLKARLVDDAIDGRARRGQPPGLARADARRTCATCELLLNGGDVNVFGERVQRARAAPHRAVAWRRAARALPRGSRGAPRPRPGGALHAARAGELRPLRAACCRRSASRSGSTSRWSSGARVPLTDFAAAVAVAISLMFVTVLLASGSLALERDENTFGRLVRGPVSRTALLAEKVLLAVAGALPVTLLMLLAVGLFVDRRLGPLPPLGGRRSPSAAVAFAAHGHADRRARARGAGRLAAGLRAAAAGGVPRRWSRPAR